MEFDDLSTDELKALVLRYKTDREVSRVTRGHSGPGSMRVHLNDEIDTLSAKIERVEIEINYRGSFSPLAALKAED